jgi:hypothetical protein
MAPTHPLPFGTLLKRQRRASLGDLACGAAWSAGGATPVGQIVAGLHR